MLKIKGIQGTHSKYDLLYNSTFFRNLVNRLNEFYDNAENERIERSKGDTCVVFYSVYEFIPFL